MTFQISMSHQSLSKTKKPPSWSGKIGRRDGSGSHNWLSREVGSLRKIFSGASNICWFTIHTIIHTSVHTYIHEYLSKARHHYLTNPPTLSCIFLPYESASARVFLLSITLYDYAMYINMSAFTLCMTVHNSMYGSVWRYVCKYVMYVLSGWDESILYSTNLGDSCLRLQLSSLWWRRWPFGFSFAHCANMFANSSFHVNYNVTYTLLIIHEVLAISSK